jgi:hypothetical protein
MVPHELQNALDALPFHWPTLIDQNADFDLAGQCRALPSEVGAIS